MELTEAQLAYAAGIFDGEGHISVKWVRGGGRMQPVALISVTNTDPRLLARLREWFGGTVSSLGVPLPRYKQRWGWQISALKAAAVLTAVLPYLLLKREQAELVLAVQATKRWRHRGRAGVPPEVVAERVALVDRLRVLNKRGA